MHAAHPLVLDGAHPLPLDPTLCAWSGAKHAPLKLFSHQMDSAILRGAGVSLQFTAHDPVKSCSSSKAPFWKLLVQTP